MLIEETISAKQKKEEFHRSLIYVTILTLITLLIFYVFYTYTLEKNHTASIEIQTEELKNMSLYLENELNFAVNPLHLFNTSQMTKKLLEKGQYKSEFQDILLSISNEMTLYEQIRFLDLTGQEIVRVDRNHNNQTYVVDEENLQNKKDRYYFKESILLPEGLLYISPLDLNIENGEIEFPYKPVIRIGTAIYKDETAIGTLLVNLNASSLLDTLGLMNIHHGDTFFLLNKNGYYLYHPKSNKTFGFMFDDQQNNSLAFEHPDIWEAILDGETHIENNDGHYFVLESTLLSNQLSIQSDPYYFIMFEPITFTSELDQKTTWNFAIILIFVLPLLLVLGWNLGAQRVKNKWYKAQLVEGATRDNLTGLFNHRMIISLTQNHIKVSKLSELPLSVMFVDINDLKYVNDIYGHHIGDHMIIEVANALKDAVRTSDPVARLGGDEFLVTLQDCNKENAEMIAKKALLQFKKAGIQYIEKEWTFSYGIATLRDSDDLSTFINRADTRMYDYKRLHKKNKLS